MPSSSPSPDVRHEVDELVHSFLQARMDDTDELPVPEPLRSRGERFRAAVRRRRIAAVMLTVAMVGLTAAVWASPPIRHFPPGPTPEEVALQREQARAADLKRQLDELQDGPDGRADDLKRQVDELEEKLGLPHPQDQSRANDLKARLTLAEMKLRQGRPPVTDPSAAARADDLAAQNDVLEEMLRRPRPAADPLANVTASLTKAQILAGSKYFGLYTAQSPFDYAEVNLVQSEVKRKANIVGYFQSWKNDFRPDAVKKAWLRGQIPLLTWESQPQVGSISADVPEYSMPKIIGGQYDDYVRRYARDIASLGMPLILRFDHEMNGTWYPWSEVKGTTNESINGNSRGDYVRMWQHVHDIFQREGANDYVIWVWAPNRVNAIPGQPEPKAFYPGDDYVDWVGMSGYYRPYDDAPTFSSTHGKTLPLLRATTRNRPIFLAEIGATELNGQKAKWISSMFDNLKANPDIIGFAWFSLTVTNKHEGKTETNDWRLDSTPTAVTAAAARLNGDGWGVPLPADAANAPP